MGWRAKPKSQVRSSVEFLVPDGLRTHDSCVSGHFVRRERAVACLGIYASMKDISKMRQARIQKP